MIVEWKYKLPTRKNKRREKWDLREKGIQNDEQEKTMRNGSRTTLFYEQEWRIRCIQS